MLRTMFAMTVAGLLFAAVSGTSQAAPIAPLPSGVTKDFRRPYPSVLHGIVIAGSGATATCIAANDAALLTRRS